MEISQKLKIAIKLADRPAYRIAQEARVDPHWLSKVIRGAVSVSINDERILKLAKVLKLESHEIFETKEDNSHAYANLTFKKITIYKDLLNFKHNYSLCLDLSFTYYLLIS